MDKVFVVLPGFNEEKHVKKVVESVKEEGFLNIVYVDDGSFDSSVDEALSAGVVVLRHRVNLGKGAATRTGCDFAVSKGARVIVLMDSDGQHEAKDIKKFVSALKGNDVVFGFREFGRDMPFTMRLGNIFLTRVSKFLFSMSVRDTQSGFRCFSSDAYKKIRWFSSDYGMESEMIARASKHGLKFSEVKIRTIYHDAHKGTTPLDGVKILFNMLRHRFF
ncbi:glycosyltransferase family 2 protein [Candidatus Woesearchaeota archaeon]|nr:glycosyltransferase family 2 protein [Candidatus Woesearchaeota archaeon]